MSVKLLVISGSHPRHVYATAPLLELGFETLFVQIQREDMIPEAPSNLAVRDKENFQRHFRQRKEAEELYLKLTTPVSYNGEHGIFITDGELNSPKLADLVAKFAPDIAVVFGSGLIRNPLLSYLPEHTINLHLGISPEYKGSATLFWPFYMLEPQFAGYTIHKVVTKIDAGGIYTQGVPELSTSDGIHDVACKTVLEAQIELMRLVCHLATGGEVNTQTQKRSGKLWLTSDFTPSHLRIIYNTFDNDLVRAHLNKEVGFLHPRLHVGF